MKGVVVGVVIAIDVYFVDVWMRVGSWNVFGKVLPRAIC